MLFFVTMLASKAQITACWLLRLWVYPFLRADIVFSISWGTLHFWSMYHFIEPFCTESVSYVYCIPCCSLWLRRVSVSILLLILHCLPFHVHMKMKFVSSLSLTVICLTSVVCENWLCFWCMGRKNDFYYGILHDLVSYGVPETTKGSWPVTKGNS